MTKGKKNIKKQKSDYLVLVICHALEILEQFQGDIDELGVTELSKRLNISKNMVFRILATLEHCNFIVQNGSSNSYRLGVKNLILGRNFVKQSGLVRCARPVLEKVTQQCNEASCLATLNRFKSFCLDVVESTLPVQVFAKLGQSLPLHCSAAGKAQIAWINDEKLDDMFAGRVLKSYTNRTITDVEELRRDLRRVVAQGYAIEVEELANDVRSVAAPVRDHNGLIVGAISITGPAVRFSNDRMENELIPLVKSGAKEISQWLGYHDCKEFPALFVHDRSLVSERFAAYGNQGCGIGGPLMPISGA